MTDSYIEPFWAPKSETAGCAHAPGRDIAPPASAACIAGHADERARAGCPPCRTQSASNVVALLEDRVREELRGTDGGYSLGLSEETIERLLDGVTAGVLYA
jgi:hypothetical protein